ncbi:efflux RND transporter periplasmic adaptor subunit [Pectobacterium zantedeschiae]|uniref:efflux RND transporter periplasmic adaptor subunit n=1 Tax=Pectobacterium zantedeschiae TaxID=2034769 RepID=UPI00101CE9B5|nr:efflux RND transporter periplasmic adaptor subunit [Pectobacterium zantedeschiae]RYC47926.1 efflux RND transporter periplasmic adaptor subunit [Pectobacterium zantedeschiae]
MEPGINIQQRKRFLGLLLVLGMLGIAISFWGVGIFFGQTEFANSRSVEVSYADIDDVVTAAGQLSPMQYVDVGVQVSGQIQNIAVTAGSIVKKGQLVAQIDPALQIATVEANSALLDSQRAAIRQQMAQLKLAQHQNIRQRKMLIEGATSEQDVQSSEANLRIAQAQLESLQAQVRQTESTLKGDKVKLGYTQIYAPIAGTVVSLQARPGQTLNAVQQTPVIMRIADLTKMTVSVRVSEADIPRLRIGMPVYFSVLGYPKERWEAKLQQIMPAPQGSQDSTMSGGNTVGNSMMETVFYTVLFDIDNADGRLMSHMSAQVYLVVNAVKQAISVPISALTLRPDGHFQVEVLPPKGSRANAIPRLVQVGIKGPVLAQITSGLDLGEHVLLPPLPQIVESHPLW